ncbi:hypothetical protein [Singulisphaera sp. PoT]|uniref:hypothetical protein n=1 Tax=Singulisphaera sp. PoT TaxID=3411797 RepID=UPI003BF58742
MLEQSFETGQLLLRQGRLLATFPILQQSHDADGKVTIVNPVPPATIRAAASVAKEGAELAGNAIARALEIQGQEERVVVMPRPVTEAQGEATRRVEAHRAAMRARMLTMSPIGPGLSLEGCTSEAAQNPGAGGD